MPAGPGAEAMDAAADWLGARTARSSPPTPTAACRRTGSSRNLRGAGPAGADAVAGRDRARCRRSAALLPPSLHWPAASGKTSTATLLTEAEARIDPDPHDPWPCHRTTIGATLARQRRRPTAAVGGMPAIALGEDGAFVALLLAQGLHVRHDPAILRHGLGAARGPGARRRRRHHPGPLREAGAACATPGSNRCRGPSTATLWRRRLRRLHAAGRLGTERGWARRLRIDAGGRGSRRRPSAGRPRGGGGRARQSAPRASSPRPEQLPGQIRLATAVLPLVRLVTRPARRGAPQPAFSPGALEEAPRPEGASSRDATAAGPIARGAHHEAHHQEYDPGRSPPRRRSAPDSARSRPTPSITATTIVPAASSAATRRIATSAAATSRTATTAAPVAMANASAASADPARQLHHRAATLARSCGCMIPGFGPKRGEIGG